jgi:hypothetical protein
MLTIFDRAGAWGRRDFLRIGSLGLGGMTLPGLLSAKAIAAERGVPVTDKSVIFLFLHGGPSQIETFDPKLTAPTEIASATGEVSTSIPGITFGGTFTKLAQRAQNLSVVRSFVTGDGNHDIKPIVGKDTSGANLGAIYSRLVGANHPTTGMPTNVALYPQAVDSTTRPTTQQFGKFESTGPFGSNFAPFVPGSGGALQEAMKLSLPMNRLDDRRALLTNLDRVKLALDAAGQPVGNDKLREQAFDIILGGVADAFDLSKEDAATIARYDTALLVRPDQIDKKWNNYNNYVDNAKSLGKLLLLARRLCEAGCGFVTVTTNFVWDMHSDVNNAPVEEGMRYMGVPLDHAVSAFLDDVEARGLSNKILLVACGEMGRTPRINKNGGRDHWGGLASLLLSGGGLKMGQVIGQSTRDAGEPLTEPVTIRHLIATIYHTLFDVGQLRVTRGVPNEVLQAINNWEPIRPLI